MEEIKDKKLDAIFKTLAQNKYPYLIANDKVLKMMYPDIPWTDGIIMNMENNLKIFCTDSVKDDKIYTNLDIDMTVDA